MIARTFLELAEHVFKTKHVSALYDCESDLFDEINDSWPTTAEIGTAAYDSPIDTYVYLVLIHAAIAGEI